MNISYWVYILASPSRPVPANRLHCIPTESGVNYLTGESIEPNTEPVCPGIFPQEGTR